MSKWRFDPESQQIIDEKDNRIAFVDPYHTMNPEALERVGLLLASAPEMRNALDLVRLNLAQVIDSTREDK